MSGFDKRFDDLDRLVTELNLIDPEDGSATVVPSDRRFVDTDFARLDSWLQRVRSEAGGSDLLLVAGSAPIVRAPGRLLRISTELLASERLVADYFEAAVDAYGTDEGKPQRLANWLNK